jgi:hypothetical protein
VSPESHGAPGRVIRAAVIWEINHVMDADRVGVGP